MLHALYFVLHVALKNIRLLQGVIDETEELTQTGRQSFKSDKNSYVRKESSLKLSAVSTEKSRPARLSLLKHTLVRQGARTDEREEGSGEESGEKESQSPLIPEPGHENFVSDNVSVCESSGESSPKH